MCNRVKRPCQGVLYAYKKAHKQGRYIYKAAGQPLFCGKVLAGETASHLTQLDSSMYRLFSYLSITMTTVRRWRLGRRPCIVRRRKTLAHPLQPQPIQNVWIRLKIAQGNLLSTYCIPPTGIGILWRIFLQTNTILPRKKHVKSRSYMLMWTLQAPVTANSTSPPYVDINLAYITSRTLKKVRSKSVLIDVRIWSGSSKGFNWEGEEFAPGVWGLFEPLCNQSSRPLVINSSAMPGAGSSDRQMASHVLCPNVHHS